jgi:hypothetical protein
MGQRDAIKELSPPWLAAGNAERLMYEFGLCGDVLIEKLNQAMHAHMPGQGTSTALVYIGSDRAIPRGPYESNSDYAGRLTKAFDSWQRAGMRRAIMSQVAAYLSLTAETTPGPMVAIVGGTAPSWDIYNVGDDVSEPAIHYVPASRNWDWDGHPEQWWRAWLVIYVQSASTGNTGTAASMTSSGGFATVTGLSGMSSADVGRVLLITNAFDAGHLGAFRIEAFVNSTSVVVSCGVSLGADPNNGSIHWDVRSFVGLAPGPAWGNTAAAWGDMSRSWGLANPPGVMAGVISILRQWQSEHSFYPETVICFSSSDGSPGTDLCPYSAEGAGNPDGTWGHFSKIVGGDSVPARIFTGNDERYAKFNCFCGGSDE